MTLQQFCRWSGVCRTTAYKEISAGRLRTRKVGRRTVVLTVDAEAWLTALPETDHVAKA